MPSSTHKHACPQRRILRVLLWLCTGGGRVHRHPEAAQGGVHAVQPGCGGAVPSAAQAVCGAAGEATARAYVQECGEGGIWGGVCLPG